MIPKKVPAFKRLARSFLNRAPFVLIKRRPLAFLRLCGLLGDVMLRDYVAQRVPLAFRAVVKNLKAHTILLVVR